MADVFVSYKAEDRRRVEPLVRALESDGFSVWWDAHIGGGDHWRETILKNLEEARCVIVVWSKRSVGPDGEFVRDEATRAKRRGHYLPVRIDKIEPPLGFGETQALSLQGWKGDPADRRYQAVLQSVRQRLGQDERSAQRDRRQGLSRRTVIAAGVSIAAVAGVGAGVWWFSKPGTLATSIAVLPFENLSGDPAQAYFSDGIAEELRSALARIAKLKVVARTSSEAVRNDDAKTAARKLDVAHILTGSVRRSPSLIRISAQLIDGDDGTERWSQDYDRPAGDALQIQSDIASRVATALALQLAPTTTGHLIEGGTANPRAHDLFLQGLAFRQGPHDSANLTHAIALFDAAIRLDPRYADAYAVKAGALAELSGGFARNGNEMRRSLAEAAQTAHQALEFAPDLPSAHAALGAIAGGRIDFTTALAEFRKAAAGSQDAVVLDEYAHFLAQIGFAAEAHRMGKRVIALDPLNGRSYAVDAQAFYSTRDFADAVTAVHKVLQFSPGSAAPLALLGDSLTNLGKFDEARAVFAQMPPADLFRLTSEGVLDERLGKHAASKHAVDAIERANGVAASYQLAQLHAQRGEADLAFSALDDGVALPDPGLIMLLMDPYLDPIRRDPRFAEVRKKIPFPAGLPG